MKDKAASQQIGLKIVMLPLNRAAIHTLDLSTPSEIPYSLKIKSYSGGTSRHKIIFIINNRLGLGNKSGAYLILLETIE